ncbi:unnamed protein product, partial [Symbiodinium sp. KB8]
MKVKRSSSLPTAGAGWTRSELIGCIPVDSAYCGQTGNSADAFLVEHLRPRSRQGPVDRIGLADAFHRMNTSAEQAWYATETSTGGVKMMSVEDGYKVLFRKKKEGSNTALDEPKYVFDPLCRWIDAVRLRHFRDAIEQTCAGGRKKRMGRAMGKVCEILVSVLEDPGAFLMAWFTAGIMTRSTGFVPWLEAKAMAAQMCRSMMLQQRLIASLALQYEAKVLDAWGNHIPRSVRESATSIFFLPILLWKKIPLVEQMPYNWLRSLFQLRKYVSTQVKIFDWEAVDDLSDKDGVLALATQYVMLLRRWKKILRTPVANARFPVHEAPQRHQWIDWFNEIWRLSHTEDVWKPAGTDMAFFLWHFSGTWSLSEASAESIASVAGRLGRPTDSTAAVSQMVSLRDFGFGGTGNDDHHIHSLWA